MNPSYLYHAFGVRHQECTKTEYKGNQNIHYIQTRKDELCCPECKSRKIIRSGSTYRDIRSVPVGHRETILRMKVQRIECKSCGCIRQEKIHFVTGKRSYTNKFLSRIGTIKDVALFLNISWDTVKDIQKRYLQRHYGNPDLSKLEYIGIDEFAVRKGHVYKTIVADLLTGQVVYVGDGKGADALEKFWKKALKAKAAIKAVATDLSAAFISSVRENAPDATLVFDHFHVVKLMNDTLDKLRRQAYNLEADLMKRKVLKGTRWLLLCNGADIYDSCHRNRLVEQAQDSKVPLLQKFAMTLMAHRSGILSWYDHHISTGKLEGINNKIKTMKRQAYGYRLSDEPYFFHLTSSILPLPSMLMTSPSLARTVLGKTLCASRRRAASSLIAALKCPTQSWPTSASRAKVAACRAVVCRVCSARSALSCM